MLEMAGCRNTAARDVCVIKHTRFKWNDSWSLRSVHTALARTVISFWSFMSYINIES